MFSSKQFTIVKQGVGAAIFGVIAVYLTLPYAPKFPPNVSDGERIAFAFRCLVFSILPLFAAIREVASRRFNNMETLGAEPTAPVAPSHEAFKVCERVLQNTLEQTVLHIVTVLALVSCLEVDQLYVIPALVLFFVIGRACYFVGYLYSPLYRGFGFTLTFTPTIFGFAYAIYIIALRQFFR